MKSFRENPEGEENQRATRDNERYIFALKMEHAKQELEELEDDDQTDEQLTPTQETK